MPLFKNKEIAIGITARALLALVGGFVLANLFAILLAYGLTGAKADNLLAGMMVSFVIYTAVVMFVFSVKTTKRAFVYVVPACLICWSLVYLWVEN